MQWKPNALNLDVNSAGNIHLLIRRLNHEIHELMETRGQNIPVDHQKVAHLICLRKESFSKLRCVRHRNGK